MLSYRLYKTRYHFSPSFGMSLLTLLTLGLFIKLGLWQLQRAIDKKSLITSYAQHRLEKPLSLDEVTQQKSLQFRTLAIEGHYDQNHTFLLDNRFYNHQLGYHVLTPFYIDQTKKIVLINRGFIPLNKISSLATSHDNLTLRGLIDFPTADFRLNKRLNNPLAWPRIIESLNLPEISQTLSQPLLPFVVKLLPSEANGFVRDWSLVTTMPPERHQAYAFQWFALAFAVFITFIVTNSKK